MLDNTSRIIVIGDLHGDSDRLVHCLRAAMIINDNFEWIADPPNTYVVQMGDQVDGANRNPNAPKNWDTTCDISLMRLMDVLDERAQQHGGRVLSLIGNHEIMNMIGDYTYVTENSLEKSGGVSGRSHAFCSFEVCGKMLANRYVVLRIGSYLFSHAGITPSHLNDIGENINELNVAFRNLVAGAVLSEKHKRLIDNVIVPMDGCLWTRKYMDLGMTDNDKILQEYLGIVLQTTKCNTMFIGHNTVPNTTVIANGRLVFTDACFSRAYGLNRYQYIDILDNKMRIVEVKYEI